MAKKNFIGMMKEKTQSLSMDAIGQENNIKAHIIVFEELKKLIPPLTIEEKGQLKENIIQHGIKDPLTIWETKASLLRKEIKPGTSDYRKLDDIDDDETVYVLIDGHNRHEISQETGIDFRFTITTFKALQEVKDYMINLQLGRRNLTPDQMSYLRGLRYNQLKKGRGNHDKNSVNVAKELASEFKVSDRTVKRDGEFAEVVDRLDSQERNAVLSGKTKLPRKQVPDIKQLLDEKPESGLKHALGQLSEKEAEKIAKQQVKSASKDLESITTDDEYDAEKSEMMDTLIDSLVFAERSPEFLVKELKKTVKDSNLLDINTLNKLRSIIEILNKKLLNNKK